jgi:hypothetical protein
MKQDTVDAREIKMNRMTRFPVAAGAVLAAVMSTLYASGAQGAGLGPVGGAIGETKLLADLRLRSETVEQEPLADDASALTLRGRLGFETGKAWSTSLLVEGDFLWPLITDYNSTVNGKGNYPVVADPEAYELNRMQLVNTAIPNTTITLGRQRIVLDDHRFVGNVGWRQNEQTFDALRVVNKTIPNVTVDVTYANQVNRVFGPEGIAGPNDGRFTGDNFLANVSWQLPAVKVVAFGYFTEFEQAPVPQRDTHSTLGLRLQGERPLSKVKMGYVASWARQEDRGDNPLDFSNDYLLAELTGTFRQYSLGAGYELLEGDGVKGFATPLATLHRFQGWADKFLATPVNGLVDKYVNAGYTRKGVGPIETFGLTASWHDYTSDVASIDYGSELDVQLSAKYRRFTGTLKLADYSAAATTPAAVSDTRKLWVQIDYVW